MTIELENLLNQALTNGINLFLGAGFSVDARNFSGENLPLGRDLASKLSSKFNKPKLDLPKVAQMIESTSQEQFYTYLREVFSVDYVPESYRYLEKVNILNIYTSNIDNLVFKIFSGSERYYVNDISIHGPVLGEKKALNYYPLHGCIQNKEKPMLFTPMAMSSTFSKTPKVWYDLVNDISESPTIFWGYSLSDPGILASLETVKSTHLERKEKWIILFEKNEDEEQYFRSLGFNIIIATNNEFLNYINTKLGDLSVDNNLLSRRSTKERFGKEFVPSDVSSLPVREINDFYLGASPIWFDIFRPDLYKISHYRKIYDNILSDKNNIVVGIAGSGKSTLLLQLAANFEDDRHKIILSNSSVSQSENIINSLGSDKAIIFVDNFTEDIESFLLLHNRPNIKLIGFGREHNFEIISHFIDRSSFEINSITSITPHDAQEIYNRIPNSIRKSKLIFIEDPLSNTSLFEFVNQNLTLPSINERYKKLLNDLELEDDFLLDFLVLSSYVHSCNTPLSFDMVYSYFSNGIDDYNEIFEMKDTLGELLKDNTLVIVDENSQDYFTPRSSILSEAIIKQVPHHLLKRVLTYFLDNVHPYKIVNYDLFKRRAYDKNLIKKAFPKWSEGKSYYEDLIDYDPRNPYLWQQGALYLADKNQYNEAFIWIEHAKNMSSNRITSIRNSHAIILFQANIYKEGQEVKETLDRSMEILRNCFNEDKRKLYHAKIYCTQARDYYDRYADERAIQYLAQAKIWLEDELNKNSWNGEIRRLLRDLNQRIK